MAKKLNELNVAVAANTTDIMLVQQAGDDKQIVLEEIKNMVMESVFPVGATYLQLPAMGDPSVLGYPGSWTNVSSTFAGDFFRVEGGDASAFEAGEQLDALQGHYHKYKYALTAAGGTSRESAQGGAGGSTSNFAATDPISDGLHGTPRTDSETRPVNQTIRVWKRTA